LIRLVSCDLDGTLLDSRAHIRPRSGDVLRALDAQGVIVALATGRSWRTAYRVQKRLGLSGPIIAHNGAYGFFSDTGREWHRRGIPLLRAQEFVRWADRQRVMLRCYLGFRQPVVYNRFDLAHQLVWMKPEDRLVPRLAEQLTVEPLEIFVSGLREVDALVQEFGLSGSDYELTIFPHPGYREVNICAPGVDKKEGLESLCQLLQISPHDVLALGDGLNDVEMLRWAGVSVAIGDGARAAQQVADYITPPGHPDPVHDGIFWAWAEGLLPTLDVAQAFLGQASS